MTFRDSGGSPWTGRLVTAGVVVLVAGLAAATFILSYDGVRDLAIAAGVSWRLARLYPAILDGVLVVACAAAFMLRDSSLWRRIYAWFAVALLVGVVGAADALHAMNVALPKRPAAGTVAALPWALVMLGFSLWLTMLRHARPARPAPAAASDLVARGHAPAALPSVVAPPVMHESAAEMPSVETVVLEPLVPGFENTPPVPPMTALPEPSAPSAAPALSGGPEPSAPSAAPDTSAPSAATSEPAASAESSATFEPAASTESSASPEPATPTRVASVADDAPEHESAIPREVAPADARYAAAETTEDLGASEKTETTEEQEVIAPRLYRVRSTPVPPAD